MVEKLSCLVPARKYANTFPQRLQMKIEHALSFLLQWIGPAIAQDHSTPIKCPPLDYPPQKEVLTIRFAGDQRYRAGHLY